VGVLIPGRPHQVPLERDDKEIFVFLGDKKPREPAHVQESSAVEKFPFSWRQETIMMEMMGLPCRKFWFSASAKKP